MRARGNGVDPVPVQGPAYLVQVLLVELLGIVELVVVHQLSEAGDRAGDPHGRRLARMLGLVAARHEARHHRPEGPDSERGLHAALRSSASWLPERPSIPHQYRGETKEGRAWARTGFARSASGCSATPSWARRTRTVSTRSPT